MNASVIAIFSEPKKYGIACGIPILVKVTIRLAPSERMTSFSSGSMVAMLADTTTATGKITMIAEVMTAGTVPSPAHSTSSGTNATFGMLLTPISVGKIVL